MYIDSPLHRLCCESPFALCATRLEHELEHEVRFQIEMQTEDIPLLGMNARDAGYAALRKFGGVESIKEEDTANEALPI